MFAMIILEDFLLVLRNTHVPVTLLCTDRLLVCGYAQFDTLPLCTLGSRIVL